MKRYLAAALVTMFFAAVSFSQPDRDLVGTWKMDASRSKSLGVRGAPASIVIRFEREGDMLRETLTVAHPGGETTRTISYAVDGRELVNGSGDESLKSKAVLKANAIVLEWIDEGGTLTRNISFSNDRRTMTINVHDSNPDGESDDLIVLQRQ